MIATKFGIMMLRPSLNQQALENLKFFKAKMADSHYF